MEKARAISARARGRFGLPNLGQRVGQRRADISSGFLQSVNRLPAMPVAPSLSSFELAEANGFRASLWDGVDALTRAATRPIVRDDGTTEHAHTPSLWDQAIEALSGGGENASRGRSSTAERCPVDLELLAITGLIRRTTRREVATRNLAPRASTPARMRQLAAHVVTHEPGRLWWYSYRFTSWARLLGNQLCANDHVATPVRLRNTACPSCGVAQVRLDLGEGPVIAPALVIDFHDGYVRAAQCEACSRSWWRGAELELLAEAIGCGIGA